MKLSEAREKFKDEWMAFIEKEGEDPKCEDPKGEVLFHHQDRDAFDEQWPKLKVDDLYITFNGPAVPPGHAICFPAAA